MLLDFMGAAGHGDENVASLDRCGAGGHVDEVLLDVFRISDEVGFGFLGGKHDAGRLVSFLVYLALESVC